MIQLSVEQCHLLATERKREGEEEFIRFKKKKKKKMEYHNTVSTLRITNTTTARLLRGILSIYLVDDLH